MLFLFLPAARTAVLSFTKAKEASTRERDLFRSVKVNKLTAFQLSAKSTCKFMSGDQSFFVLNGLIGKSKTDLQQLGKYSAL